MKKGTKLKYKRKSPPPFSDEHRKNLRIAKIGYKPKPVTEETRLKMRNSQLGKKLSNEHKKNISKAHKKSGLRPPVKRGADNHLWRGGVTDENELFRKKAIYKKWRISVFKRDGYQCQMKNCDKSEKYVQAHHIKKFSEYPELRLDISNGITLCKNCHISIQWKEEEYEEVFTSIILEKTL